MLNKKIFIINKIFIALRILGLFLVMIKRVIREIIKINSEFIWKCGKNNKMIIK